MNSNQDDLEKSKNIMVSCFFSFDLVNNLLQQKIHNCADAQKKNSFYITIN